MEDKHADRFARNEVPSTGALVRGILTPNHDTRAALHSYQRREAAVSINFGQFRLTLFNSAPENPAEVRGKSYL